MNAISKRFGFGVMMAAALVSSGCGQNATSDRTAPSAPATAQGQVKLATTPSQSGESSVPKRPTRTGTSKIVPPPGTAVITGWVLYQGAPPKPKAINFGPEKVCASLHADKPPVYETLVLNSNGTLKWALAGIRGAVPGTYPPPDKPVVMDQVGCIFTPHVVGALVGQEIDYRNSDPVSHNIRGTPKRNTVFNQIFAPKSNNKSKLDSPEVGIPLKCDIHYWMSSYIHVFPHPFFAITGDDGSFVISGVPPGSYTLLAWHESLGTQTQLITLSAGEVKELDFTFIGRD
jgi:plastocyanin